jgi:DNA-binding SARP family transcriptional activator
VEVRLLGPVEVWAAGRSVDAGSPRQRCVLAALAADAGRSVPTETLIDRVWGQAPPEQVRQTLYVYITRIRNMINRACPDGGARLLHRSGGYLLDLDADRVDMHRFRRFVDLARDPDRGDAERADLLGRALDLWRGAALADLSSCTGRWATVKVKPAR